jgi:hypothetical protein
VLRLKANRSTVSCALNYARILGLVKPCDQIAQVGPQESAWQIPPTLRCAFLGGDSVLNGGAREEYELRDRMLRKACGSFVRMRAGELPGDPEVEESTRLKVASSAATMRACSTGAAQRPRTNLTPSLRDGRLIARP